MDSLRAKLVKLLNLTQSDNDNEALSSIRVANAILKKHGLDWDFILNSKPKPSAQNTSPDQSYDVDEASIYEMLDYIEENAWEDFDDTFINSISESFETYNRLTWKQVQGLKRTFEAVKKHHEREQ